MQDKLSTEVLDLGANRREELTESYLTAMGTMLQIALERLFAGVGGSMKVRGSRAEVESFKRSLAGEKRYMDNFMKYGLDDSRTYRSKSQLMRAVEQFERTTGLKWPFK